MADLVHGHYLIIKLLYSKANAEYDTILRLPCCLKIKRVQTHFSVAFHRQRVHNYKSKFVREKTMELKKIIHELTVCKSADISEVYI